MSENAQTTFQQLNLEDVKNFVLSVAKLVEKLTAAPSVSSTDTGMGKDDYLKPPVYNEPTGGWISVNELRTKNQAMVEAIAREKWFEGFVLALELVAMFA